MKPENIKKVWEHYRGFQIRYRIGRSQYIIDAFNKNMNGDFSPSLFINPIESKVHLIVKEYIKCLLEQEALEQAQQEQTTIDTQQKSPVETKNQKQTQQPQAHKARRAKAPALKFTKEILGEVSRSDGGVKNRSATEEIKTKPTRAITLPLLKEEYSIAGRGIKKTIANKPKPAGLKLPTFSRGAVAPRLRG